MIDKLIETGRYYGMEMDVEKTKVTFIQERERGVCGQRQELKVKYITFLCSSQHTVWQKPVMEMGQCRLMQAVTKDFVCSKDKQAMWWV